MQELERMGSESTRKTMMNHGAPTSFFGVKVGDMKQIVKKVKKDHQLSLDLYRTGNADAMYLAGLIADEKKISIDDLEEWVNGASWHMISEFTVSWVAAESKFGWELASRWIRAKDPKVQSSGWCTYISLLSITSDDKIDKKLIGNLVEEVAQNIHSSPNRVKQAMNMFLISVGSQIEAFYPRIKDLAKVIGKVEVDMGGTKCATPEIVSYIDKTVARSGFGKKKKMARC